MITMKVKKEERERERETCVLLATLIEPTLSSFLMNV
jgi:hypothetical protein